MIRSLLETQLDPLRLTDRPYRISVLMAYFFLLRQSEYIYSTKSNDHALRTDDIEYRVASSGVLIPSFRLASSRIPLSLFDLVKVTLRHCKNDPFRQGNSFWCLRSPHRPGQVDLVNEMLNFSMISNSLSGDVFTSIRCPGNATPMQVTYRRVMKLISSTACKFGFNPKLFGTHSFRISGATTLAAGQVAATTIQKLGGWRSMTTQMEYSQASSGAFSAAHQILHDERVFTIADLQLQVQTLSTRNPNTVLVGPPVVPSSNVQTIFPNASPSSSEDDESI
jgi:hypothetical protein